MLDLIPIKNQVLLNTYRKEIWEFYNFSIIELFIFDRFFNWATTNQMVFIIRNNIRFYLIDYKYIAPSWGMSKIYLKKIMLHLSGSIPKKVSTNLKYPLIRYTQRDEYKKWKSYFGFEIGTMNTLIAWDNLNPKRKVFLEEFIDMTSLFSESPIQQKQIVKDKNYHKVPYNKNVYEIYEKLKTMKENGKRLFVNHITPADDHHYNSTFEHFQDAMLCLYEGRFLTTYNLGKLDDWFRNKFKYYLNEKDIQNKIRECKGSWINIHNLLIETAKNYSKWFDIDTEQYNKSNLPRSINDWIYSAHNQTSMFYVSLLYPPTSAREADAEKIFNKIKSKYRKIFYSIYQGGWDGFTFWNKINNVIKWYNKYYSRLASKDSNCLYWFGGGIENFLYDYKEWLLDFTNNKPFLKNIGIDNNTFDLYIKQKIKDHDIEIEIPRSL